jgi:hypothetical protein
VSVDRKIWDPAAADRGVGDESSDYVDGWNDALNAVAEERDKSERTLRKLRSKVNLAQVAASVLTITAVVLLGASGPVMSAVIAGVLVGDLLRDRIFGKTIKLLEAPDDRG